MTDFTSELNSCRSFGERLKFHLFVHGTRLDGAPDKPGEKWGVKAFADAVKKSDKSVQNWLSDRKCPTDLYLVNRALFGANPKFDAWRRALQEAHRTARAGEHSDTNEDAAPSGLPSAGNTPPSSVQIMNPEAALETRQTTNAKGDVLICRAGEVDANSPSERHLNEAKQKLRILRELAGLIEKEVIVDIQKKIVSDLLEGSNNDGR